MCPCTPRRHRRAAAQSTSLGRRVAPPLIWCEPSGVSLGNTRRGPKHRRLPSGAWPSRSRAVIACQRMQSDRRWSLKLSWWTQNSSVPPAFRRCARISLQGRAADWLARLGEQPRVRARGVAERRLGTPCVALVMWNIDSPFSTPPMATYSRHSLSLRPEIGRRLSAFVVLRHSSSPCSDMFKASEFEGTPEGGILNGGPADPMGRLPRPMVGGSTDSMVGASESHQSSSIPSEFFGRRTLDEIAPEAAEE